MKKITPFLLGLGLTLIMVGGFLSSSPKDVGAATVVSLGKNGTSEYLLYPTDTLSAYTFIATSTTASSSFANGINLTNGCFAIGSVCLPTLSANNTWTGAQTFGTLTASTGTIDHLVTDELTAKTSGGSTFRSANGTPVSILGAGNSANVLFYGGVNIDGAVRMATSLNGLALLTNGAVTSIATSSLGLLTTDVAEGTNLYFTNPRVQTYLDTLSKGYFFSTTSADAWDGTKSRWSTTSSDYWLSTKNTGSLTEGSNLYFTNGRVQTYLDTIGKGYFYSTTSADYWLTTKSLSTASSTLLGDTNTWSQTNQFSKLTFTNATGTGATTTNLAISSVASKILLTNATGGISGYAGTSCTNQFVRSLSALGSATCATVGAADVSLANLTATNGTLTFSGTYNGATARTIGLNLANANTWTGGQIFGKSTTTNATSTNLYVSGSLTEGNTYGIITATSSPAVNIASTTLDAMGKSFSVGTSTFLLYNAPEPFKIVGFYCKASTTGTALVRFGDGTNFTETGTCTSGSFTKTATNNTFTAFEDFMVQASSTAGTVNRITVTAVINKTGK